MADTALDLAIASRLAWRRQAEAAEAQVERLREALEFARKRLVYYGTISDRQHFDHDLAEVYPKIDAALNQQSRENPRS